MWAWFRVFSIRGLVIWGVAKAKRGGASSNCGEDWTQGRGVERGGRGL